MLKIDLGCGSGKLEGFIGMDLIPAPGVDVVCDLDKGIPVRGDSVDLVVAVQSLEYLADLTSVMCEIHRVCRHGAQVCIVAAYGEQKLNRANPRIMHALNEHSPRFWTKTAFEQDSDKGMVHGPGSTQRDPSSVNPIQKPDFRLKGMEFFYLPEYRNLPPEQQEAARKAHMDVCDQIMYHLMVWKDGVASGGLATADPEADFEPFVPDQVRKRKVRELQDRFEFTSDALDRAQRRIQELREELARKEPLAEEMASMKRRASALEDDLHHSERRLADLRGDNQHLRERLAGLFDRNETLSNEFLAVKVENGRTQAENTVLADTVAALRLENTQLKAEAMDLRSRCSSLDAVKTRVSLLKAELDASSGLVAWYRSKEASWNSELSRVQEALTAERLCSSDREQTKRLVRELHGMCSAYPASRTARFGSLLEHGDTLWDSMPPAFGAMKDYVRGTLGCSPRARLVLGEDLGTLPYREYAIPLEAKELTSVSLAVRPLLPSSNGAVGIEIVSPAHGVFTQALLPLSEIRSDAPSEFVLPAPFSDPGAPWWLRIFTRDADTPVALYELIEYSGLRRRLIRKPFVLLR